MFYLLSCTSKAQCQLALRQGQAVLTVKAREVELKYGSSSFDEEGRLAWMLISTSQCVSNQHSTGEGKAVPCFPFSEDSLTMYFFVSQAVGAS